MSQKKSVLAGRHEVSRPGAHTLENIRSNWCIVGERISTKITFRLWECTAIVQSISSGSLIAFAMQSYEVKETLAAVAGCLGLSLLSRHQVLLSWPSPRSYLQNTPTMKICQVKLYTVRELAPVLNRCGVKFLIHYVHKNFLSGFDCLYIWERFGHPHINIFYD